MGKVSRNCTEDGWSETFPHYTDVCFFDDNTTGKHVRLRSLPLLCLVAVSQETWV